mmetsp:Transcript_39632/g.71087  ORF Transcript_39632/g.71087 Transcript_39632/m.71087 type:complete len:437 (-) Transcript_39632:8-1318(-)
MKLSPSSTVCFAVLVSACWLPYDTLALLHRATAELVFSWSSSSRTNNKAMLRQDGELAEVVQLLQARPGVSKRPLLTVELQGGLGNQLFQVATLLATALDQQPRFAVVLPNVTRVSGGNRSTYWHSIFKKVTPLLGASEKWHPNLHEANNTRDRQCTVEQTSGFDPSARNCSMATAFHPGWLQALTKRAQAGASSEVRTEDCSIWSLRGYFQDSRFFGNHLPLLWRVFWDETSVQDASARLAQIAPIRPGSALVSVHYRLGDYDPNGWVLDRDYYDQAVVEVRKRLGIDSPVKDKAQQLAQNLTCLIISDDPGRAWARSNALDGCDERILVPKGEDDITSFYMMSLAEASVLADSTFSYFASLLGLAAAQSGLGSKRLVVAPQLQDSPDGPCWSYLLQAPETSDRSSWVLVPARTLSSPQLIADEVMELIVPPSSD